MTNSYTYYYYFMSILYIFFFNILYIQVFVTIFTVIILIAIMSSFVLALFVLKFGLIFLFFYWFRWLKLVGWKILWLKYCSIPMCVCINLKMHRQISIFFRLKCQQFVSVILLILVYFLIESCFLTPTTFQVGIDKII